MTNYAREHFAVHVRISAYQQWPSYSVSCCVVFHQVGGRSYEGNRIAPGPQVGGSGAPQTMAKYVSGSQVAVYYNPEDPSDAALEVKVTALGWLWLALILVDVVLVLVALFNLFL